ncbi:hypothetical protein KA068_02745 [Candidatus Saccharibacteria bacterium]|nr:hypothetical protein [Candidatus Saccharibacteria bacterium]
MDKIHSKISTLFKYLDKPWKRIGAVLLALLILVTTAAYSISQWYIHKHSSEPLVWGTTFIPNYAKELGVDPKQTLKASIDELGIKRYRLVSYWKDYEKSPGNYDFTELDWQVDMIEAAGGSISMTLGLRQPRWPECHGPEWAMSKPINEWYPALKTYIQKVMDHYKDRSVIVSWQLENEFLLEAFGECPDHTRERLVDEMKLVKQIDTSRPVVITRSNNAVPSWPVGSPRADIVGTAVYKRIWDKYITRRYFEYPIPAWYYGFLAGGVELTTGKQSILHELQAEPWLPEGFNLTDAPVEEMYKSMSPEILQDRLQYAKDTGLRTIDLWGMEWWYAMKQNRNSPELWKIIQNETKQ